MRTMTLSRTRLVSLRKAAGYSQPMLAAAVGISVGTLRQFEQGRTRELKSETVYAVARTLGVRMEDLFEEPIVTAGSRA